MKLKRGILKSYPVASYFILVFLISWGTILMFLGGDGLPISQDQVQSAGMALLLGTTGAMLILTSALEGKAGFKRLVKDLSKWKANIGYYLFALLTAPATAIITLLVLSIFDSKFMPKIISSSDKIQLVGMGIAAGLVIAFFEEVGWTGFAVPRMLDNHGVLFSGIVTGSLWGLWHFPPFWQEDSFSGILPLLLLLARLFSWIVAYRVLMVWLYQRTQSLLLVLLMHMSLVVCMIAIEPPLEGSRLITYILSWSIVLWLVVAIGGMVIKKRE